MQVNLYEVLGIPQDYPQERIPQAFRNRAKQIHPDKHHPDSRDEQKQATIMLL
jgi:DnaJ-class molecular chaperone